MAIVSPTRLHLRGERAVRLGELLEGEPRDLGDDVVDRRLEARGRFARDVVRQLVQPVADRQLRGDLGDRETGRLGRERADERLTRGFISMTIIRPVFGLIANWMFDPPVSTPISRITASDASRIRWYSLSESVCAGATVIESPVWTPIASKFSIEQMITTLSSASRITSISYSFQPRIDSSTSTSVVGEASRPCADQLLELGPVVGDARAAAAHCEARPHDRTAGRSLRAAPSRDRRWSRSRRGRPPGRS